MSRVDTRIGSSYRAAAGASPPRLHARRRRASERTAVSGHGGGGPRGVAICNDMDVFADGTWTVVVMSNVDAPFCGELKAAITEMLAVN